MPLAFSSQQKGIETFLVFSETAKMYFKGIPFVHSSFRKAFLNHKLVFARFQSSDMPMLSPLQSFEEIRVPVPWGYITGKWWGRRDTTPVIGLHGFEDNCGTFDRLAPLLNVSAFLALDAPGHGRSSHIPCGMIYSFIDFVVNLRRVVQYYGWHRFSIIGHSFGSAMGHIYSSLYPSDIEKFVSLDCARTIMANLGNGGVKGAPLLRRITEKTLKADCDFNGDPPAYRSDQILNVFCQGTLNSVSREHAKAILDRGMTAHPKMCNHYYFTRDQKLRYSEFNRPGNELLEESAKNVKCHVLAILGTQGFVLMDPNSESSKLYFQYEKILKKSSASYRRFDVNGTHHVHLNNPERVAPLINMFFAQNEHS